MNKWADHYIACNPTTAQSVTSNHLSLYDVPPTCVCLNKATLREVSNEGEDYGMTDILFLILK